MWENRITFKYIQHEAARAKLCSILNDMELGDDSISELSIKADSGYVFYVVELFNGQQFTIFDDGITV